MIYTTSFRRVYNGQAYRTARLAYFYVAEHDGKPYMFTRSQLDVAHDRALSNPEDIPQEDHVSPVTRSGCSMLGGTFVFLAGVLAGGLTVFTLMINNLL